MSARRTGNDLRLRLELIGSPASAALIRSVIRSVAHAAALDDDLADDMRSAITEACNNAVLHAYPAAPGSLIFSLTVQGESIEAVVRDQGCGIRPTPGRRSGLGMGITLINALADRAEFESSELGTEVRMVFKRPLHASEALSGGFNLETWALSDPRQSSGALRARSN